MILAILVTALWFNDNAEFVQTSNEQLAEGYRWVKVGKSVPSETPALTIESNGNEFIYYRLERK